METASPRSRDGPSFAEEDDDQVIVSTFLVDAYKHAVMAMIAKSCGIVRRAEWGAQPPKSRLAPDWSYDAIVVHYTGHDNLNSMSAIQDFDLNHRHWDDIAYHYAVSPAGRIYEGRELIYKGAHVKLQNTGKIGIVCMGDFDTGLLSWWGGHGWDGDPVQSAMLAALERLSRALIASFPIKAFGGHMEYGDSDTCPGSKLLPAVQAMRDRLKLATPVHKSL